MTFIVPIFIPTSSFIPMILLSHIRKANDSICGQIQLNLNMMNCLLCECLQQREQVPDYDPGPGLCLLGLLSLLEQPCWPFLCIQHTIQKITFKTLHCHYIKLNSNDLVRLI